MDLPGRDDTFVNTSDKSIVDKANLLTAVLSILFECSEVINNPVMGIPKEIL